MRADRFPGGYDGRGLGLRRQVMDNMVITDGSSAVLQGRLAAVHTVGMTYEPACVRNALRGAGACTLYTPKKA